MKEVGYEVLVYPGWKSEEYASGLKIAIAMEGDVTMSQYYTRRGGDYPANFDEVGVVIKEVNHKIWAMGKDIEHANKGVDVLIQELKKKL